MGPWATNIISAVKLATRWDDRSDSHNFESSMTSRAGRLRSGFGPISAGLLKRDTNRISFLRIPYDSSCRPLRLPSLRPTAKGECRSLTSE